MQVTVELQDNFSYMPIVLLVAAVVAGIVLLVLWSRHAAPVKTQSKPVAQESRRRPDPGIRQKYDAMLAQLMQQYEDQKVTERQAYQKLSKIVREFAFRMTGVRVQNYTLQEIRVLNQPKLTELIEECYVPEFALRNQADFAETLNTARKVIREWI